MSNQKTALIYGAVVPVTLQKHRQHSVEIGADFSFAAGLHAVPILSEEFAALSKFCPIVFAGPSQAPLPHALLGMKQGQNVFIGPNGGWAAPYIPAFLRRYPFISAPTGKNGSSTRVLCIDSSFSGLNTQGKGHALFDANGTETKFLKDAGSFVAKFDRSLGVTRAFMERLAAMQIIEPMAIQIKDKQGAVTGGIGGMMGVSRARLDALNDAQRQTLTDSGDGDLLDLQHASLRHLSPERS